MLEHFKTINFQYPRALRLITSVYHIGHFYKEDTHFMCPKDTFCLTKAQQGEGQSNCAQLFEDVL